MTEPPFSRKPGFADEPARPATVADTPPRGPELLPPQPGEAGPVAPLWTPAQLGAPRAGLGTLGLASSGVAVLIAAWAGFGLAGLVADQFAHSALLGWAALTAVGAGVGLLGASLWREWRGIAGLARVDALRAALADPSAPLEPTREAALAWLRGISARLPDVARVIKPVQAAASVAEIAGHLRAGAVRPLAAEAARSGRRAAMEGGAIVALSPSPSLDAVIAGWRALALVREVAALHGLRPGLAATAGLLRRTVSIAATTAGADLLAQTATEGLVGATPVVRELAAAVPGAGVTAFRLYRLAVATAAACSPLPPKP